MTGQCVVEVERVWKRYQSRPVLMDVSLDVRKGECMVLCGPSGSGKSTLLRCVNGLEDWHDGEIRVDGFDIATNAHRRGQIGRLVGMVFQDFNLFPHMSVLDNVSLGPRVLLKQSRMEAEDAARDMLDRVGITEQADKYPHELSGGQQQRVAIARSLAMRPRVMLFDEPTSALDPEMVKEVLDVMRDLSASGMTMMCVTHEMGFARNVADRVVFLTGGCVCETAKPCDFFAGPSTPEAIRFLSTVLHS